MSAHCPEHGGKIMAEQYTEYIADHEDELLSLLCTLARIPAPTGKEGRRAQFCRDWLTAHGAQGTYIDSAGNVIFPYHTEVPGEAANRDGGIHQKAEAAGEERNRQLIVFDAHMDVVFPDETELPLTEREGRIYCPGVGDDTANLAVLLMTAAYAAEFQPDTGAYGVLFVCGAGEEGLGNLRGVREICASFGRRIRAFYAFDLTMEEYTCRAVGSLRYRITVHTKGGHSYHCFGSPNANAELAGIIQKLYRLKVPVRGKTTYNVGMISGGTSVNTIAQQAELLYEIRSDDVRDLEEMREMFEGVMREYHAEYLDSDQTAEKEERDNLAGAGAASTKLPDCRVTAEQIGERPCEKAVDERIRKRMFRQVEDAVKTASGIVPIPVPCSTDCNIPLSMGIPSVCVGTCRGAGAHTREEYIEKDSLAQGLQIALQLFTSACLILVSKEQ